MTSIAEARFEVERRILELCVDGVPPLVAQVDAVLADNGTAVFFYTYLVDDALTDGEPLFAIADLPRSLAEDTFDPAAFVEAFWQAGAPTLTRN